MSDQGLTPGAGAGFPTTSSDAAPAAPSTPAAQPQPGTMTPEAAKQEIAARRFDRTFMERYWQGDPRARADMDALYAKAHPEPDPNEPTASPPATRAELDALTIERVRFPTNASDDDRATFRITARDGLAALGATHGEAAGFAVAASEVLRDPDRYTPETAAAELRRLWGGTYDANLALAKAAVQRLPPAVRAHLLESPVSNHPAVMKILADAGRRMRER